MFDTICTLPLTSDLFAQAIHPTEPIVAAGLSGGHVETFRLPPLGSEDSDDEKPPSLNGFGQIESQWRTRRHKGSCRCLGYSIDGEALYSAGTDGIVKVASTATGQVSSKIAIPLDPCVSSQSSVTQKVNQPASATSDLDGPSLIHALSPQTLLLATDSSALYLYDIRANKPASKPQQTHHPHDDYISSLTPLPPSETSTSGFSKQWVTTGGTTLAVTDLRRGVLVRSEDQEEELLSSVYVGGLPAKPGRSKGEKILVGGGGGVLTLWEKGVWDDQDERIIVHRGDGSGGESLDAITLLPGPDKIVAVGLGEGSVKFVRLGPNKMVSEVRHDEVEGVVGLGFEAGGRMISGGGAVIKVWHEKIEGEGDGLGKKHGMMAGSDSDSEDDQDEHEDSSDEEKEKKRRKKRKRNKGKDRSGGQHVMAFKGLD